MKRLYIILYVVILFLSLPAGAQSLSNAERRHINSKALSHLEEYERLSSLYDEEAVEFYKALFVSEDASVLCDMIGADSYLNTVSVAEYARTMTEYASVITVTLKDVARGNLRYEGGIWHVPMRFRKSVSYIDDGGYVFSTEEYHRNDFDMTMMLRYDPETDSCLIESVTGELETERDFPEGRFLIVNESDRYSDRDMLHLSTLKVGGNEVVYNEFGQAVLPSGEPYVEDFDVEVGVDTVYQGFNYDVVTFSFNPRKGRVKLRYAYAPLYAYKVTAPGVMSRTAAMELGVDFGTTASCGQFSKIGFYAGIGVSASRLELWNDSLISYTLPQYEYIPSSKLFRPYDVEYNIAGEAAKETVEYVDFMVPLYLEFEHRLGRHVMLSWDLGVKAYLYVNELSKGSYKISYTSVVKGKSLNPEPLNNPDVIEAVRYVKTGLCNIADFAKLDATAFADIGLDINLYRKKTYFMFKAGYEYGFKDSYSGSGTPYYKEDKYYPIVYDPTNTQNPDVAVHSFYSGVNLRRQTLWFSTGLKFKF